MLQSEANTKLNQPNGDIELRWVEYYARIAAAQKRHDDVAALQAWEELGRRPTVLRTPANAPGTCSPSVGATN